jgi:hypothetical protein
MSVLPPPIAAVSKLSAKQAVSPAARLPPVMVGVGEEAVLGLKDSPVTTEAGVGQQDADPQPAATTDPAITEAAGLPATDQPDAEAEAGASRQNAEPQPAATGDPSDPAGNAGDSSDVEEVPGNTSQSGNIRDGSDEQGGDDAGEKAEEIGIEDKLPDESWDMPSLERFIGRALRVTAAEAWKIGKALAIAREKHRPTRTWLKWLKWLRNVYGLAQSVAYRSIDVSEGFSFEEAQGHGLSELYTLLHPPVEEDDENREEKQEQEKQEVANKNEKGKEDANREEEQQPPVTEDERLAFVTFVHAVGGVRQVNYGRQSEHQVALVGKGIIFISSVPLFQHSNAVLTALEDRVLVIEHDPTDDEIMALCRRIAHSPARDLTAREQNEVLDYLIGLCAGHAVRPSLRLFCKKALPIYQSWRAGDSHHHWQDRLKTVVVRRATASAHIPTRKEKRDHLCMVPGR